MKWNFFRGIAKEMISDFKESSLSLTEEECNSVGLIERLERCIPSRDDAALVLYAEKNLNSYSEYCSLNGISVSMNPLEINEYVLNEKLSSDFVDFVRRNGALITMRCLSGEKLQESYINEVTEPLFNSSRCSKIYIYREMDRRGIVVEK